MYALATQTEITWLPVWLADVWRLALFCAESLLLGKIFWGLIDKRSAIRQLPIERRIAWTCVLVFTFRAVVISIENFAGDLHYEGTPATTLAVILGIISLRKIRPRDT